MTAMRGLGRTPGPDEPTEALPVSACVICAAPTVEAEACCSLACAERAQRELRHNVACLRLLRLDGAATARRRSLAERNGRLSSALLRYRPRIQPTAG
jgi:predicted nucleic acid-binding Zn ribbon protein